MLRKIFKLIKRNILAFSLGAIIFGTTGIMAASQLASSAVYYDNTTSGGTSNTVSGALDELYEKAKNFSSSGDCPEGMTCIYVNGVSFADDSWETIQKAVRTGNYIYKVGDTKTITLASHTNDCYSRSGSGSSYKCSSQTESEKQITLRVANTSECTNGETSETACGFVVEFAEVSELHNFNPGTSSYTHGTYEGGWPASAMRTYINNTIYNALPSDLKSVIADTKVVSSHGSSDSSNFTSTDKLYLLSTKEVWDGGIAYDTVTTETRQLDYYKNQGVTSSNYSAAIKKYNGSAQYWWLRSAYSYYYSYGAFFTVSSSGSNYYNYAYDTYGVAPAFRIA